MLPADSRPAFPDFLGMSKLWTEPGMSATLWIVL
jgi:hypothetical protein